MSKKKDDEKAAKIKAALRASALQRQSYAWYKDAVSRYVLTKARARHTVDNLTKLIPTKIPTLH